MTLTDTSLGNKIQTPKCKFSLLVNCEIAVLLKVRKTEKRKWLLGSGVHPKTIRKREG